jgi:hypothetical protein
MHPGNRSKISDRVSGPFPRSGNGAPLADDAPWRTTAAMPAVVVP